MTKKQMNRIEEIKEQLEVINIGDGYTILNGNETELDRTMSLAYELIELLEGD